MSQSFNYGIPCFKTCRELITGPVSAEVSQINEHCLRIFGRNSIIHYGFLPVLLQIKEDKIITKLYYDPEIIRNSKREMEDFTASFFKNNVEQLDYRCCNIIMIPVESLPEENAVNSCNSMPELEQLIWAGMPETNYVGMNPNGIEGGLYIYRFTKEEHSRWKILPVEPGTASGDTVTVKLHLFRKTGGEQPAVLDAGAVDHFFKNNYAKVWAMRSGFISTFKSYHNGKIMFDIISDQRFTGNELLLSKFIAKAYKDKVDLLKDATSFEADHFIAKDIIGYYLTGSEIELLDEYQARVKRSYAELSDKPVMMHFGSIR